MIAADTSEGSALSLATKSAESGVRTPKQRARQRPSVEVPQVKVLIGNDNVTPLASVQEFTRLYEIGDDLVKITTCEAATSCGGTGGHVSGKCAQCRKYDKLRRGRTEDIAPIPKHAVRNPLSVWLGIDLSFQEERSGFGQYVSAEQFHALVDRLGEVRDRMVADGALAPSAAPACDLSEILNRPLRGAENVIVCACVACKALRAKPYLCLACGYDGVPTVPPCDCPDRKYLATTEHHVAGDADCSSGHAAWRVCPVCDLATDTMTSESDPASQSFKDDTGSAHAAGIIRDLRAALRSRGLV